LRCEDSLLFTAHKVVTNNLLLFTIKNINTSQSKLLQSAEQ